MLVLSAASSSAATAAPSGALIEASSPADAVDDDVASRVRYYMGTHYDAPVTLRRSDWPSTSRMDAPFWFSRWTTNTSDGIVCRHLADADARYRFLRGTCSNYENDLAANARAAGLSRLEALVMFGDISSGMLALAASNASMSSSSTTTVPPLLVKTRMLGGTPPPDAATTGILVQMNSKRHWSWLDEPRPAEPSWDGKRDALVWRGSTTGLLSQPNLRYECADLPAAALPPSLPCQRRAREPLCRSTPRAPFHPY